MFRGEPLALHLILTGLLFLPITLIMGLFMPGVLFSTNVAGIFPSHFISAFLGWIGLVILGSQLQFFRAISNIRQYEPDYLRYIHYISTVSGVVMMIVGNLMRIGPLIIAGLLFFTFGVIVHSILILPQVRSKYFKFPLNYMSYSHLFLIGAVCIMWYRVSSSPFALANNFDIVHTLAIGWISLNIQGAMIRILPMFTGQVIDRSMRSYIDVHAVFSFVSSLFLVVVLANQLGLVPLLVAASLWVLSWLYVIIMMYRSIAPKIKEIEYPVSLGYFLTGMIFLAIGSIIGLDSAAVGNQLPRGIHIHTNLLAGLSILMLGAIHRITSFQMYTLVYTGRRDTDVRIDAFIQEDRFKMILPALFVFALLLIVGFLGNELLVQIGAIGYLVTVLSYLVLILKNYVHYRREVPNAIPYHLKKSEVKE